jgi:hypothetical protein
MRLPAFNAEVSLHQSGRRYRGMHASSSSSSVIIPAIPPCRNCDYICDVCFTRRLACGACAYCVAGICDPRLPGGEYPGVDY